MAQSKLTKALYTDINKLRLCNQTGSPARFVLEQSPFTGDEDQEESAAAKRQEIIIVGRIFPNSDIFKEGSYKIELKLTPTYPADPPEVRFLTPMYHPHVDKDGTFCHELLLKTARWTMNTSLVDVVKAVVGHIDHPDVNSSLRAEVGREYVENRAEFDRKASEYVKKHALPRN